LLVAVVAGAFALGRATRSSRVVTVSVPADQRREAPVVGPAKTTSPPRLAALVAAPKADPAPECEPRDHRAGAASVVESLFAMLPHGSVGPGSELPETRANAIRGRLQGMAAAIRQLAPGVRSALADEFSQRLCSGSLKDDQLVTMAYLAQELPDIASSRAFDCVFSQRGHQEDVVLWYMLDAWRFSDQPKTAALEAIERSATDERTRRRFLPRDKEIALRQAASH
jgi:hypothetical protein